MTSKSEAQLLRHAQYVFEQILDDALQDYSHWDGDEDLSYEDYIWINEHVSYDLEVRKVNDEA